ncbi:unnamed protein product [Phytomonas sp. EM1]|nr:unnamed protein product [Phytomonas sp. EM1]|eukprot:CCW63731.1 unnamed protein product [Phytomonas sp. isolate EM1]
MLQENPVIMDISDSEEMYPSNGALHGSEDTVPNNKTTEALLERKKQYDVSYVRLRMFVERLWGPQNPYSPTERDRASLFKDLFYGWIYKTMKIAVKENLHEEVLPPPPYECRARMCGMKLSSAVQDRLYVRNAWSCLLGAEVVSRLDPMSRGTLRWVGVPQQGGYTRLMAGVEWRVVPAVRLAQHSTNAEQTPLFDGVVHGEHLFNPTRPQMSTLEECADIEFVFAPRSTGFGKTIPMPKQLTTFRTLVKVLPRFFWCQFPLKLTSDILTLIIPFILKHYVKFLEANDGDMWMVGAALALCLFLVQLLQSCALNRYYYRSIECGLQYRSALSMLLFEKCFLISKKAMSHPKVNVGHIVTLVSTDVENVNLFMQHFMYLWSSPFVLIVAIVQMSRLVGVCCLMAVVVFLVSLPFMTFLTKWQVQASRKRVVATDERVKATNEFFSGIRVAKFVTWEAKFISKIEAKRATEVYYLKQVQLNRILLSFLNTCTPTLMIASVFVLYSALGNELTPTVVFPTIALFGLLRMPCMMIPFIVNSAAQFIVSIERITGFLGCSNEELSAVKSIEDYYQQPRERRDFMSQLAVVFEYASVTAYVPRKLPEAPKVRMSMLRRLGRLLCSEPYKPAKRHPRPSTILNDAEPVSPLMGPETSNGAGKQKKSAQPKGYFEVLPKVLLHNVSLQVPMGKLTMVLGPTGCGKSTLLQAILGQLEVSEGRAWTVKNIAYVPQQPWIMNASLRENILFFAEETERLAEAIRVSQLKPDIELLDDGLETEIGEKGVNLSGGQKARVSLARAVYADREMYLLDDPLSALDAHVGERVLTECILGTLAGKTRILTTHQWHTVQKSDYVIVLDDRHVVFSGESAEFMESEIYSSLVKGNIQQDEENAEEEMTKGTPESRKNVMNDVMDSVPDGHADRQSKHADNGRGGLITKEEKAKGSVQWSIYMSYALFCGGKHIAGLMAMMYAITEILNVSASVWLSFWSTNLFGMRQSSYLTFYIVFIILGIVVTPLRFAMAFNAARRGSVSMHRAMLRALSTCTMGFFDSTPLGRILNRFSRDVDVTDNQLPLSMIMASSTIFAIISSTLITIVAQPVALVALVPCGYINYRMMKFYNAANREIRRTSSIVKSPLFSLLGEVLGGTSIICAYGREGAIMREALRRIDLVYSCNSLENTANRWLAVRIEFLSNVVVTTIATAGVFMVASGQLKDNIGIVSLSLTLALQTTAQLIWLVRCVASVEADMNSVERIIYYTQETPKEDMPELDAEVDALAKRENSKTNKQAQDVTVEAHALPVTPDYEVQSGSLELRNVDLRYREGLPLVLHGVSFRIEPGEKVGIVGRTGSGKSTLMLAFMRLVDISGGEIIVNDAPIRSFPVRKLRQLFSMIPQDPLLFEGTVRQNLDPFLEASDKELWHALNLVGMHTRISNETEGLDSRVQEGGTNFSVGQRQLLCMARAVLKKNSRFILMDEATANIDPEMDQYIQGTVMRTFATYTVITIAHRLQTVAQYDKIIVMQNGRAAEIGSPYNLVNRQDSIFRGMVESMGSSASRLFMETTNASNSMQR